MSLCVHLTLFTYGALSDLGVQEVKEWLLHMDMCYRGLLVHSGHLASLALK